MSKKKNKNYLLIVVITLDLVITMLCLALGCLMYTSNSRSVLKNLEYVEVTGLISNIDYGLHFGKSIESYYGMQDLLDSAVASADSVDAMYIVNDRGEVIFKTGDGLPDADAVGLSVGSNLKRGKTLYCSFKITGDVRLITAGDISDKAGQWYAYYRYLAFISFAGFMVSALIMILIWRRVPSRKAAYRLLIVMLILWVLIISSYVGYSAYNEYSISINSMCSSIDRAAKADISKVHDEGIEDENITGFAAYLKRYADNIPEIESVNFKEDMDGCDFELSKSYLRKVTVDYVLQTLLFLAFSAMILTEYQLFMSGIGIKEWEEDDRNA